MISMRASAVQPARGLAGNANDPSVTNDDQPPPTISNVLARCAPPSRTKTCRRPSALGATTGSDVNDPPKLPQPLHPLCGAVCQTCTSGPVAPTAKTSSRPSALRPTTGFDAMLPPSEPHALQPVGVPGCSQMCATDPS